MPDKRCFYERALIARPKLILDAVLQLLRVAFSVFFSTRQRAAEKELESFGKTCFATTVLSLDDY